MHCIDSLNFIWALIYLYLISLCIATQITKKSSIYTTIKFFHILNQIIKAQGYVSVAKKDVQHTSALFTGTAKSPFSTPCISITAGPISIKFTYFMASIYTSLYTKFEVNRLSSFWNTCFWKLPDFLYVFLLCTNLKQYPSPWWISFKFSTLIGHILAYLHLKFEDVYAKF